MRSLQTHPPAFSSFVPPGPPLSLVCGCDYLIVSWLLKLANLGLLFSLVRVPSERTSRIQRDVFVFLDSSSLLSSTPVFSRLFAGLSNLDQFTALSHYDVSGKQSPFSLSVSDHFFIFPAAR